MRTTRHWGIGILGCLALTTAAYAEEEEDERPDNGQAILAECSSRDPLVETRCLTYITGFLSGWNTTLEAARRANVPTDRLPSYCFPARSTLGGVRDAIVKGLSNVPKGRNEWGNVLVMEALQKAFPCPPEKPKTSPARK